MSLPVLAKVPRFQVNNTIAGNASLTVQNQNLLFALHTAIIGGGSYTDLNNAALAATNPATVVASCDSSTFSMAGVNKWVAATNIVTATAGGNVRSWIVYFFSVIGLYVLIDCQTSSGVANQFTVKVSHTNFSTAAGGADGSTTVAPTALNSITLFTTSTGGLHASANNATVLHAIAAQDGSAFSAVFCRGSFAVCTIHFGKPINPRSGWTHPYAAYWLGNNASAVDAAVFATVCSGTSGVVGIANAGTSIVVIPATTGYTGALGPSTFTAADSFSSDYPIFEIILQSVAGGSSSSYLGLPPDMWFGTTGHSTGSGYPSSAVDAVHPRQFMKLGCFVYPWNNSVGVFA